MARTTNQVSAQLWQSRFEQFQDSKLTVRQFCNFHGCEAATFYYWRRKLGNSSQRMAETETSQEAPRTSSFVPVLVRPSQSQSVIVWLCDGTKIELQCDAISALHTVLQEGKRAN